MLVPKEREEIPVYFFGQVMDNNKIFQDHHVRLIDYVYHICSHIQWILVGAIFLLEFYFCRVFFWTFLSIQVADLIDFIITFNTDWFYYNGGHEFTMNILAAMLICMATITEMVILWKRRNR